jgi:hydrogenase maturation protease
VDVVIGIGNTLRMDDGIGARVVAGLPSDAAETMIVHQLTPELAERLHNADRVLFVDAAVAGRPVALRRLHLSPTHGIGHAMTPEALLDWTARAYGRAPEGWLLAIVGRAFDVGEGLSREAEEAVPSAIDIACAWLGRSTKPDTDEEEA